MGSINEDFLGARVNSGRMAVGSGNGSMDQIGVRRPYLDHHLPSCLRSGQRV